MIDHNEINHNHQLMKELIKAKQTKQPTKSKPPKTKATQPKPT